MYKMENVRFDCCKQLLGSQADTLRWYVSRELGNVTTINDGYLQSVKDSAFPPTEESAWACFVLHDYHNICPYNHVVHKSVLSGLFR